MAGVRNMRRTAAALLMLAGCAQTSAPPVVESIDGPPIGALERAYDRAKWQWVRNADGRPLLTHRTITPCFVDPQPPLDVHDPGFTVKRHEKTIGATRYEVLAAFEKRQFWEAIYVRAGSKTPLLGVYAEGQCQREAEAILEAYERSLR